MRQYQDLRPHLGSGIHSIDNLFVGSIDVCLNGNEPWRRTELSTER